MCRCCTEIPVDAGSFAKITEEILRYWLRVPFRRRCRFLVPVLPSRLRMKDISIDGDNLIDWGRTSADYSRWRPNYPDRFFDALMCFGVGLQGQRILDLGTGVGFLAL